MGLWQILYRDGLKYEDDLFEDVSNKCTVLVIIMGVNIYDFIICFIIVFSCHELNVSILNISKLNVSKSLSKHKILQMLSIGEHGFSIK
jgi:hypothetical protein